MRGEEMKEERHVAVVACGSMSGVTHFSPVAAYSPARPPLPTPSPFSFSVASTRWSSRPPIRTAYLFLRFCFTANILMVIYALCQLFKSICDLAHRGIFISDVVSDYIRFIFYQLAGYLLVSASSVAVPVIQKMYTGNSFWKATVVSVCLSFASVLVIAATALLSGYKLCKRIVVMIHQAEVSCYVAYD